MLICIAVASMVSNAKVRSLERAVEAAKQQAKANEEATVAAEIRAAEYMQKMEYLDARIAEIGTLARKQDEELEKIGGDIGNARRDVERARSVRAIGTNTDELCGKLGELGYPC